MGATQAAAEVQHPLAGRELNAAKHGMLSRHAVLPWEDRAEFDALLASLVGDHAPRGAAEQHLVEELAVTMWRKQRILLAEAASHRAGFQHRLEWDRQGLVRRALPHLRVGMSQMDDPKAAVAGEFGQPSWSSCSRTKRARRRRPRSSEQSRQAQRLREGPRGFDRRHSGLVGRGPARGLDGGVLGEDTRADSDDQGEQELCRPDGRCLLGFLEGVVSDWLQTSRQEVKRRCLVRGQALGEALDPERLDKLARYETHLDRKLGRTLAMLLKLQEMRRTITAPAT